MCSFTPGVYSDLSNAEYRAIPALSASDLKLLNRSPAHYKYAVHKETPAMKFGSAVHAAILEPERFKTEYIPAPEIDKRTKAGKEAWAELEASGKIVLPNEEFENVLGIAESVRNDDIAGRLLINGRAEHSVLWNTSVVLDGTSIDVPCKCRPDFIQKLDGYYNLIDIKTTEDSRPYAFIRAAHDYSYRLQAGHYVSGCRTALDLPIGLFVFLVTEKVPPYAVAVYVASQDFMNLGHSTNSRLISQYARCKAEDKWPAYECEIQELGVPAWAR